MVNPASAPRLFELHAVNTFLPGSPATEVPDLCLESFGLERVTSTTTEKHEGSWWNRSRAFHCWPVLARHIHPLL
jgi:hypothetical protein